MKLKKGKSVNHVLHAATVLPMAVLGVGVTVPVQVAHATTADPSEIVVTARRTEEVIQTVPISMTVFNQEMLDERNVTNAADLVAYTPSLNVNSRFGSDQASFAIRGFTQDLRTTASVAVYFADVVAPRGGGSVTAGDGAGPGAFFDLQNVQILKGPQGTLFGRNTTGGAIQLVPQEPTTKLEGYLEASRGNYDMNRLQGVLNVPLTDNARSRFGFDTLRRDGYVKNQSEVGPDAFSNTDYLAARGSLLVDITDTIHNYTIYSYTHSENNGSLQKMFACNPGMAQARNTLTGALVYNADGTPLMRTVGLADSCRTSLQQQGHGFYNAVNDVEDPVAKLKQWQIINSTTWDISEAVSVKNNLSFADLEQDMRGPTFGSAFSLDTVAKGAPMSVHGSTTWPMWFFPSLQVDGVPTNSQTTMVEELRFNGTALDDKLTWQAGYYYENSRPDGWSGSQSPGTLSCWSPLGNDPSQWECADLAQLDPATNPTHVPVGSVERAMAKVYYNNQAVYTQGTYDLTDEFRVTLGLRYTWDETSATTRRTQWAFPSGVPSNDPAGAPVLTRCSLQVSGAQLADGCVYDMKAKSEAPTWLIDFDYLPNPDMMVYAKYARGYRQGSVVTAAPDGLTSYDPEQVDAYEIGMKNTLHGMLPGTFNVALFYNELKDQQLQLGYLPTLGGSATTAITNAGSSTIQGLEVETTLHLLDNLIFNFAYTYLDTHLDSLASPPVPNGWVPVPSVVEGGHLSFSPRHTLTAGLSYRLPLPAEVGDVSAGVTYTFTSSQLSAATDPNPPVNGSPYGELGARQLVNLNLGWKAIYGSPFDASFFMTNALDEKYYAYVPGMYNSVGAEFGVVGEPKMWGARVKYNFQ